MIWAIDAKAYDNKVTHRLLSDVALDKSNIGISRQYLIDILGEKYVAEGQVLIQNQPVSNWLKDGADFEDKLEDDKKSCRAANHFHNPIKGWQDGTILPWDQAQMTDGSKSVIGRRVNEFCVNKGWSLNERKSSVTWGTAFLEPVAEGALKAEMPRQQWSWDDARQHFYDALTAVNKNDREQAFADTFRGVGHVVHLIQDAAQPAHVRNDFQSHLNFTHFVFSFADWDKAFGSLYEYYVKVRKHLVLQAQPVMPEIENPSLTDFWDTNTYDGSVQLNGLNLGLSELANANYLSDETIPNNVLAWKGVGFEEQARQHLFPFPKLTEADYEVCMRDDISRDSREIYIARRSLGGCAESGAEFAMHYATASFLNMPGTLDVSKIKLSLDDKVYETYARELLPLAIGYSSALINYFFRGRLGLIKVPGGVRIRNNSDDPMQTYLDEQGNSVGQLNIYYDDATGYRHFLATYTLSDTLAPNAMTPLIAFDEPSDNVIPGRYVAVFRGKLGKEEGAVMGRVASPGIYYVSEQLAGEETVRKIMRVSQNGTSKSIVYDNSDPNFSIGKFSVSADGSRILFSGQTSGGPTYLYLLDISGPNASPVLLTQGVYPDWSPLENKFVFQRGTLDRNTGAGGQILIYDLDAKTERLLISGEDWSGVQPAWSPDGQSIAYLTNDPAVLPPYPPAPGQIACGNAQRSIEIMDLQGVHLRSATECLDEFYLRTDTGQWYGYPSKVSNIENPAWSSDGAKVLYTGNFEFLLKDEPVVDGIEEYMDFRYQLYTIDIGLQDETALFNQDDEKNVQFTGISSWSLDGSKIAVTRYGVSVNQKLVLDTADIILIDSDTADESINLTAENTRGDFYPDYAY